jgi:hypothetical protein
MRFNCRHCSLVPLFSSFLLFYVHHPNFFFSLIAFEVTGTSQCVLHGPPPLPVSPGLKPTVGDIGPFTGVG